MEQDATSAGGPPESLTARFAGDLRACADLILAQGLPATGA